VVVIVDEKLLTIRRQDDAFPVGPTMKIPFIR
jgi:hypothetical protein